MQRSFLTTERPRRGRASQPLWALIESGMCWINRYVMYRRIIVGIDGSSHAEHALRHAVGLAKELGAGLRVVHVVDMGWLPVAPELGFDSDESRWRDARRLKPCSTAQPSPPRTAVRGRNRSCRTGSAWAISGSRFHRRVRVQARRSRSSWRARDTSVPLSRTPTIRLTSPTSAAATRTALRQRAPRCSRRNGLEAPRVQSR